MLSNAPIPSMDYNSLPDIQEQYPPSECILRQLGLLFVQHGVNDKVGISILHKHFQLEQGEIMAHDGLRCSPMSAQRTHSQGLSGNAFFLGAHEGFQAYEYETQAPLVLGEDFTEELQGFLRTNHLADQLALSRIDSRKPALMEYCEEATRSHVCERAEHAISPNEATEWRFDSAIGVGSIPVIVRGCARTTTNDHKPKT